MTEINGVSQEKLQRLKRRIERYLADGKLSEEEEYAIFTAGKAAGIPDADTAKLIAATAREKGLDKKEAMLPSLRLWIRHFLKDDGVIDDKERFVLEEIAEKIGLSKKELATLISDEQKKVSGGWKVWKLILIALIVLIVILRLPFWHLNKASTTPDAVMQRIPIAELAVYDFRFAILTDAHQTTSGDLFIRIVSGGFLGKDEEIKILYQAGVDVKYGIALSTITPDRYTITDDCVSLTLPQPTVIGLPRLLTHAEDAAKQIAAIPEKADTTKLQEEVRRKIQDDAKYWPQKFALDSLAKKRVTDLITAFINTALPGKKIVIEFENIMNSEENMPSVDKRG